MFLSSMKVLIHMFLFVCFILGRPCFSFEDKSVDSHLAQYSQYNVSHHDNIDDGEHTHGHKHSENGDEHEHKHDHLKISQTDFKLLNCSLKIFADLNISDSNQSFSYKNLTSSPFPLKIYRPPIYS